MLKKLYFLILLFIAFIIFTYNYVFAQNSIDDMKNTANNVKNAVGNAENAVENTVKDVTNSVKNETNEMQNNAQNDAQNNSNNYSQDTMLRNNTSNYNATRTSSETNNGLFGMNSTTWIWLILAIAAIGIISLVYYYSAGVTNNNHNYKDNDE